MRATFAPLALAALAAANPMPQGVTSAIAPESTAPASCQSSYDGEFQIEVVNVTSMNSKRSISRRQDKILTLTLEDGTLMDDEGRTGYIAANNQFQFDKPAQTGAIYTSGFSVCENGTLALGGSAIWYQCLSGGFYNLYDQADEEQCTDVYIMVLPGTDTTSGAASQIPDGQVTASPQPVTQISDGQIQATTDMAAPVTQIGDGQIQAPTSTAAPVTQISDGQVQAPTSAASPVTQIGDGQIQAPSAGTGMPMAPSNGTGVASPTASAQPFEGAAASFGISGAVSAIAAGFVAVAML